MANSTKTLNDIANYIRTFPEIAPLLQSAAGGYSNEPMCTIATDVMTDIIAAKFNWKWNRFLFPVFYTNSWQQDYATNVINLGWLEGGVLVDINNTAIPKPQWPLEAVQQLPTTSTQYGMPGQFCWLPNDQLKYGVWGAVKTAGSSGTFGNDPQPLQAITNGLGQTAQPINPINQVADSFGNLWVVTTYGVTGASTPFATNQNPSNLYPTVQNPNQAAQTVTDGSVVWTAVNPKGFGIRLNPIPPQNGTVFQVYIWAQLRALYSQNGGFTKMSQTIEPIPDDWAKYFRTGCIAYAYEHSPDAKVRAKAMDMKANWMRSLQQAFEEGDRERTNFGFYPATSIMQQQGGVYPGPAYPYQLPAA